MRYRRSLRQHDTLEVLLRDLDPDYEVLSLPMANGHQAKIAVGRDRVQYPRLDTEGEDE
jgi:hypothetical protein